MELEINKTWLRMVFCVVMGAQIACGFCAETNQVSAKISIPRFAIAPVSGEISRPGSSMLGSNLHGVVGQVKFRITAREEKIRQPLFVFQLLCKVNGKLYLLEKAYSTPETFVDEPIKKIQREESINLSARRNARPFKIHKWDLRTLKEASQDQPVVDLKALLSKDGTLTFGAKNAKSDLRHCWFIIGAKEDKSEIVAYRLQLWQNGSLLVEYEKPTGAALKAKGIPLDWYEFGLNNDLILKSTKDPSEYSSRGRLILK